MSRTVSPAFAFAVACLGMAIFCCMDAVMKGLSIAIGAYNAMLWRAIAGIPIAGLLFVVRRERWPDARRLWLHTQRSCAAGISVLLFFWGLVRVPMAQGVALTFLAPLIALYLAAAMLGESIRRAAIFGSLIASVGVFVIALGQARSGASTDTLYGSGAILIASVLYAWSLILLRKQAQLADPLEVTLFTSLVIGVVLLAGAPWFSGLPAIAQLPTIGLAAVLGSFSAMMLAWAYGRAEAQVLAPVEYTAFVWSALFGWWVFGEQVSLYTVAGAGLIIAGCLAAIRGTAAPAPQTEAAA